MSTRMITKNVSAAQLAEIIMLARHWAAAAHHLDAVGLAVELDEATPAEGDAAERTWSEAAVALLLAVDQLEAALEQEKETQS